MSKRSGGPAAGSQEPRPVDLERVRSAAISFGFQFMDGEKRIVFPWTNHVLVVRVDEEEVPTLVFEAVLREQLPFADVSALAASVNEWNHERLGPTASLKIGDDSEIEVHARTAVLIGRGLSDEQLAEHVRLGVETTILMVRELLGDHPGLDGSLHPDVEKRRSRQDLAATLGLGDRRAEPRVSAEDNAVGRHLPESGASGDADLGSPIEWVDPVEPKDQVNEDKEQSVDEENSDEPGWDDPGEDGEAAPGPVTIDRVQESLGALGITKTSGQADTLIAWINGVLFGFFIDNGPSYLVKGHWDPGLNPDDDLLRVFLLCNDWNEESLTTKAYTHSDDEGLQVRVEFTVSVGAGLNDAQLEHNTAVAVNQILHALDVISTEVTGVSAVEWPR